MLDSDRVRIHTAESVLRRIDDQTARSVAALADADPGVIAGRLEQLDHEWDSDRVVEAEAAATGLAGLALGSLFAPGFLALTGAVAGAVFLHAATGWHPLMPIFRRLGVRTAREIARERYALKALRGDFIAIGTRAETVMTAAAPSNSTPPDGKETPSSGPVGK